MKLMKRVVQGPELKCSINVIYHHFWHYWLGRSYFSHQLWVVGKASFLTTTLQMRKERDLKCLARGSAGSRSGGRSKAGLLVSVWVCLPLLPFPPKGGLLGLGQMLGLRAANAASKDILTLSQESAKETL